MEAGELVKRHGELHMANIKFGYITLALCIGYLCWRYLSLVIYDRSWASSRRSTTTRWIKIPNWFIIDLFFVAVGILCAIDPHFDHLTTHIRRLGRISYALVPLDLVLAARPAYIPLDNYLDTMYLHKWISRLIVILGILHSVGFLVWYNTEGNLQKVLKWENLLGLVVFIGCCVMISFWKPVRNFYYKLFYICHNVFMITFIMLIAWHARPGVTDITMINVVLLFGHYFLKYLTSRNITFSEIIEHPSSDLKIIKFPKQILPDDYLPGSHVRIGCSKWSPLFLILPSHPYTIATNYNTRDNLASLIVKDTRFQIIPFDTYTIQPFFKSSLSANFFETAENVTIVCGGSGISLGLGVYEFFKNKIESSTDEIHLKLIWITKSEADLYVLKELGIAGVEVFITNSDSEDFDDVPFNNDSIELDTLSNPFNHPDDPSSVSSINAVSVGYRPNLDELVPPHLNLTIDYANKWIISCGPRSLNKSCEKLAKNSKCQFFSEEYSM